MTQLCESCTAIPIAKIFKQQPTFKAHRRKVGDLFHAVETRSSCIFYNFLIEAYQIGRENQSKQTHAQLNPRDTTIYFANDPDGKAWHTKAGIDTSLPACPFVWLQTGPSTMTGQPHICVSFEPSTPGSNEDVGRWSNKVYPRQRKALRFSTDLWIMISSSRGLENVALNTVLNVKWKIQCLCQPWTSISSMYAQRLLSDAALAIALLHWVMFGESNREEPCLFLSPTDTPRETAMDRVKQL